jgi:hypothetical protein
MCIPENTPCFVTTVINFMFPNTWQIFLEVSATEEKWNQTLPDRKYGSNEKDFF